jgi:hypothetical protein
MTKPRTQLIFLWNYVEWGGAQIFLLAIMKAARADWDILVVLPRGSMPTILYFLDDLGIRYEFLDVAIQVSEAPGLIDKIRRQWRRISRRGSQLKVLDAVRSQKLDPAHRNRSLAIVAAADRPRHAASSRLCNDA